MVAHAQTAVYKTTADTDNFHIGIMVGTVVSDLLQTPQGREVADGIGEYGFSLQSHSGSDGGHILFCDAHIQKLIRNCLPEGLQHTEAQVAGDKLQIRIHFGTLQDGLNKGGSHGQTSCKKYQVG